LRKYRFAEPGYPVYRAYIIPRTINGEVKYVRRLTEEDVNNWHRILTELRKFLEAIVNLMDESWNKIQYYSRLELLADSITLFFRVPLIREVLPSIAPSAMKTYLLSRLYWPVIRHKNLSKERRDIIPYNPIEFLRSSYDSERIWGRFRESGVMQILNNPDITSAVEEAWFTFPADTRPGANTSALIPHMLLTSAITWCLATDISRERAAEYRIAALIHDAGKPFDYRRHYELSPQIAEDLFSHILEENSIKNIARLAEEHHKENSPLHEADILASSIDRLEKYIEAVILREKGELLRNLGFDVKRAYGKGEKAWEEWTRLEEKKGGIIEELSEEFAKKAKLVKITHEKENDKLRFFLFDIGGIQDFIKRSNELRCVVASSMVIDAIAMAHIPLLIQRKFEQRMECWVPYECFLTLGGGVASLILPASFETEMEVVLRKLRREYLQSRIDVYLASTDFSDNYFTVSGRLASAIALRKLTSEHSYVPIELRADRLCDLCRNETASRDLDTGERACNVCYSLYELGNTVHFSKRWEAEIGFAGGDGTFSPRSVFNGIGWSEVSSGIMELLAGHGPDELARFGLIPATDEVYDEKPRVRNIAFVKVDGNLMGEFFAGAISVTDALERSARVDIALKRSIEEAVRRMFEECRGMAGDEEAKRAVAAISLGILYVGGDDAAFLCPSWASIPLAHHIARSFYEKMGYETGLSIGVAVASPRHDVWALYDSASKLLEKAKEVGRKMKAGAVCYDLIESGVMSSSSVSERMKAMEKRKLTSQPLTIGPSDDRFSLDYLMNLLNRTHNTGFFALAYMASRSSSNEVIDQLKEIRNAIRRSVQVGNSMSYSEDRWYDYAQAYVFRMKNNTSYEMLRDIIVKWLNVSSKSDDRIGLPLADLDMLIKIIGGGVI